MTASIVMDNGGGPVIGSLESTAILVDLSNQDNTDVLGWEWELTDKPDGSASVLSSTTSDTPSITPDLPGTYMIVLKTFKDAARTLLDDADFQAIRVRFATPYPWALPGAGESKQFDPLDGWKKEVNSILTETREAHIADIKWGSAPTWQFYDDFYTLIVDTPWKLTLGGAGAAAILDASSSSADSGVGWARFQVAAGGDSAVIRHSVEFVDGDHNPVFRARVKIPVNAVNGLPVFGLYSSLDGPGASRAILKAVAGNVWRAEVASNDGGGNDAVTTAVAVAAKWTDLRIEIDRETEARFYVDDVLIATLAVVGTIPTTGDRMAPYFAATHGAGGGGLYVIDYVDIRGDR